MVRSSTTTRLAALALAGALALPATSLARLPPIRSHSPAVAARPKARACSPLFGDARARTRNQRLRQSALDWVQEEDSGVTIAHTRESWGEPVAMLLRGVRLVRIVGQRDQRRAEVALAPGLAREVGCAAGRYTIGVDALVGKGTRVLEVLDSGLLVERRGVLGHVARPGAVRPRWLLAWRVRAELPPGSPGPVLINGLGLRR